MRLDIQNNPLLRLKQIIKNDNAIKALLTSTPTEIENYIDTNVNTLNDVRFVLKKILKLVVLIVKLRMVQYENDNNKL